MSASHGAPPKFFGILSRSFIVDLFGELSRAALHVYAYLRTWCVGPAGAGSAWVELRVRKIARDLRRTDRHVRRGLAELRDRRLIESEATWDDLDGVRAQRANRWRVLPEPGFPVDVAPTVDPAPDRHVTPTTLRPEVDAAIEASVPEVVAAVHGWASEVLDVAQREVVSSEALIASIEDGTLGREDRRVWGEPGTDRAAASAAALRTTLADARAEVLEASAALALAPIEACRRPRWWPVVVSTVAHRAARRLEAAGARRRAAVLDVAARVEVVIRSAMHRDMGG